LNIMELSYLMNISNDISKDNILDILNMSRRHRLHSASQPLYLKHYGYLLQDPDIFKIFFPGTARSTRESKHNDVIIISGKKGSGKTELAKMIAYI
jgi:Holliday junction resolvasome RuvABC ATP-dependent DNA helicase subunit